MKKFFENIKNKANAVAIKAKTAISTTSGEGYIDTAVKIIIAVVIGALLLGGLYALFNTVVIPRLNTEITDMFNYAG